MLDFIFLKRNDIMIEPLIPKKEWKQTQEY